MEANHFSHNQGLVFHQLPQGSRAHCSGCKSPASGNVYGCRQCSYFLDEQCYRAPRSMHHPSHPLHPLTLMSFPTYPSRSFFCDSCNLCGDGFYYCCSLCEFDLHLHCALVHNPTPYKPTQHTEAEAEAEAELRRRRHDLAMQRLQQASDSIDFMGRIG